MAVVVSVSVGLAQPLFSERDLAAAMKAAGRNVGLAHTAIAANDFETAKMRVARTREQLFPTGTFWRNRKETEAVKLLKDAITTLDDLDLALSNDPVSRDAVGAGASKVDMACQRCHAIYREQDATSKTFTVKGQR